MIVEVVLIVVALVGAVLSWHNGLLTADFAPSGDSPGFAATRYAGPWLLLAAVLVAVAGVLAVDTTARLVRDIRGPVGTGR
ncbi:hypothetical protein OHB12_21805 [Nocardia sp. NBC_01730]|uniref:hypothetical protein n=1 Tax=Nocardia sp. NBC_01730 TaxID=2975998 RepID=UPI002E151539|nr:hypothetical protein OHB12_21805 [Nocardia sp. NBC_01730]